VAVREVTVTPGLLTKGALLLFRSIAWSLFALEEICLEIRYGSIITEKNTVMLQVSLERTQEDFAIACQSGVRGEGERGRMVGPE
jgi:hypothetical protein